LFVFAILLLAASGGCGGGSSRKTAAAVTSNVAQRALVANEFNSQLQIVNAQSDTLTGFSIRTGAGPQRVVSGGSKTLALNGGENTVSIIDNVMESEVGRVSMPATPEDLVIAADGKMGYAAARNANSVTVIDTANKSTSSITVPLPRRLVLNKAGSRLLVFSDDSNSIRVVDTAMKAATEVMGFDRPIYGVFSSDDSKAFILSCGAECGGTAAHVTVLDMSSNTPGASVAVTAATVGLLDGQNLYVAGTTPAGGALDVVTGSLTVSKSAVAISGGFHHAMALASNNKLLVAAMTCTTGTQGCLTIFNASAQTAVVDTFKGDVTGLQPIANRNVVYVTEGGELRIYDTGTDAEQSKQIDITGKAADVRTID